MKEVDKFIQDEIEKDVTQEDTIDPNVETHMGEMGFLWDKVQQKLYSDKTCFGCKKDMDFENDEKLHLVEAGKTEKGVVAFVSICNDCFEKDVKPKEKETPTEENK